MKITLLKSCASDLDVVNAARVSFGKRVEEMGDADEKLIGFLIRNNHGTPFEHGYLQFHVEAPIFVFREWHRHRVGHSYNEMSGRYVELENRFYDPDEFREQFGKPGAYQYRAIEDSETRMAADVRMKQAFQDSWQAYQALLKMGVAKEQARAVLPLGIYSEMYWSCNPRSMMHFLGLRNKPDAMQEIRELAVQAEEEFKRVMPVTAQAYTLFSRYSHV